MKLRDIQKAAKDCLAANGYFNTVEIILEEDPAETDPARLAAAGDRFEAALAGKLAGAAKGVVLVVLSPFTSRIDQVKNAGASLRVHVPIAIAENVEINRAAGGFGKPALEIVEEAMRTLLVQFQLADRPFGRPEMANGLLLYYVQAETTHAVRARVA